MDLIDVRRWRKTTWAFAVWITVASALFVMSLLARTDTAAACAQDADVVSGTQAKADCVDALNTVGGFDPAIVVVIAVLGLLVLTLLRFLTRPLWRQGHGASFRRYPAPLALAEKRARRERRDRTARIAEEPTP